MAIFTSLLFERSILLCSICCLLVILDVASTSGFPRDQVPKSKTVQVSDVRKIHAGPISISRLIDGTLYVGSKDSLYAYNTNSNFHLQHNISWPPNEDDKRFCKLIKEEEECQNFITVIEQNNNRLLVCGTNANAPSCKYFNDSSLTHNDTINGLYKAPFAAGQRNQAIFAGGDLYAGTVLDSMGSKSAVVRSADTNAVMLQTDLVTEDSDSKWLNEPDFISSYHLGEEVFFFLRETAVEYNSVGKSRFSRVARVCTKDKGGSDHLLDNIWTTFLKARIVCSIPGDFPFYFNEIQDTFELNGKFYGVFTTPNNSIPGSAVCTYDLSSITEVFDEGKFKEQQTAQHAWLPVPDSEVPSPRPGSCQNDSTSLSYNVLLFAKSHTLMHDNVEPSDNDGLPLFTMTREDYRFTQILVVKNVERTVYDVLFIGTDNGKVLKVVIMTINGKLQSNLIDEITVTDPEKPEPVVSMEFIGNQTDKFILVGTPSGIVLINVQRCGELKECGCVQDPYCGWDGNSKTCKIYKPNIVVKQNITARENCPVEEITCECPEPPTEIRSTPSPVTTTATTSTISPECQSTTDVTAVPSTRVTTMKVEEQTTKGVSLSPKHTADNKLPPLSAHIPTDTSGQRDHTTDIDNAIQPIVPGRTEKVVDPSSDCTALTVIAIIGWILLAILGSILIIYFCCKRARQSKGLCSKRGQMDVSKHQEQVLKAPESPVFSYIETENAKNIQQDNMEKPSKPPVPPKPKTYDQSSLSRPSSIQRDSLIDRPASMQRDLNRELKNSFIIGNGGSTLNFPIGGGDRV
ncbi:semaphorin-1A-like isoform X4 [Ptychodera flava]|uniref:semaphorin-1A-like isoform X4 n=1 Tax=Ptychodera flava TaxID=63121 RepID=UPI00396A4D95